MKQMIAKVFSIMISVVYLTQATVFGLVNIATYRTIGSQTRSTPLWAIRMILFVAIIQRMSLRVVSPTQMKILVKGTCIVRGILTVK